MPYLALELRADVIAFISSTRTGLIYATDLGSSKGQAPAAIDSWGKTDGAATGGSSRPTTWWTS